jgi:hypothetical protein
VIERSIDLFFNLQKLTQIDFGGMKINDTLHARSRVSGGRRRSCDMV